jgi:hypothetical protein
MQDCAKESVCCWLGSAGISTGQIYRALTRAGKWRSDSITAKGIFDIVKSYAAIVGLGLAPHGLGRLHTN